MLAADDLEAARGDCRELEQLADRCKGVMLGTMAAHSRGAAELEEATRMRPS